jgi:hypothetical protein
MRRATFLILALLLPATLIIALLAVLQRSHLPAWQLELAKYVECKDSLLSTRTTVRLVDRASRPWNFTQDMNSAVFGDNPSYQTGYSYGGRDGPRPLPYLPEKVWCALLERDHKSTDELIRETTYTVVFVAEHQNLYHADIVIHEPASDPSAEVLMESLSRVGCESVLEQIQRVSESASQRISESANQRHKEEI